MGLLLCIKIVYASNNVFFVAQLKEVFYSKLHLHLLYNICISVEFVMLNIIIAVVVLF